MESIQHRHDLSDHAWSLLEPHLPGQAGQWGGIARDNRRFLNAVFWILRSGAPWRDLPPDYGDWKNTTAVSAVGAIKGFGNPCSNNSLMTPILSG